MKLGKLNRRIRLERDGPDAHDGYQNVPGPAVTLATVWAEVRPGQGSERFANSENAATAPALFFIRWSQSVADLGPLDRVRYPATDDGRLYDVQRVEEIGRREGLRIFGVTRADA